MTEETTTSTSAAGHYLSRQVIVASENGLHARPAGRLAQEAQSFEASISIVSDEQVVDAKSILDVLTLAAGPGHILELRATGTDAEEALNRLSELFKNKFEEA
ncbi:HPr family phosphocarrier protein [Pseudodesulfovibrio sediminis]|uniref:Phosphocarrier protein HPr n=1 Tax=Pseudodesulfovibrio sediminis TaxID=2810563 RepID=A0ABM7P4I3_9BACT|nr:HPr family phosphocarrier protein [Pseudodesulfovibrio sediminis]BCS88530.1 phosphocarrier protein HPr [Pseudodesulfovibrio sediminis]